MNKVFSGSELATQLSGDTSTKPAQSGTLLRVTGPDVFTFLQGQCTQDLRPVPVGGAALTLWLSLKGKVMAETVALHFAVNDWLLWSPHGEGAALKQRLENFIIADDVTVSDLFVEDTAWARHTLAGESAEAWLAQARGGVSPPKPGEWCRFGDGVLLNGRRAQPKVWDWLHPRMPESSLPPPPPAAFVSESALALARVRAGVPAIPEEFGPQDLPQEAGLETIAVSFIKGCYLGQEVMARLHAMGRVRRALRTVQGHGTCPATPAALWTPHPSPGAERRKLGELRAALPDPDHPGGWIGLAILPLQDPAPPAELEDGRVIDVVNH